MFFRDFLLENLCDDAEDLYLYDLSSATLPALSLEKLASFLDLDFSSLHQIDLNYSSKFGDEALRKILASFYSNLDAKNFMISTGASEAIFLIFNCLFDSSDLIIVQKPIYSSLYNLAQDRGTTVIDWDLNAQENWDLTELENLLKSYPQAKALVINNPNNPTGFAFADDHLMQISKIIEHRLLISDEVYRGINLIPFRSAIDLHHNSIIIDDLSKSFALPGLRLGWIASRDHKLFQKILKLRVYLSLRTPTLSEAIAKIILPYQNQIFSKQRSILKSNMEQIFQLKNLPILLPSRRPSSTTCLAQIIDKELENKLKERSIFAINAKVFGNKYINFLRLALYDSATISLTCGL